MLARATLLGDARRQASRLCELLKNDGGLPMKSWLFDFAAPVLLAFLSAMAVAAVVLSLVSCGAPQRKPLRVDVFIDIYRDGTMTIIDHRLLYRGPNGPTVVSDTYAAFGIPRAATTLVREAP